MMKSAVSLSLVLLLSACSGRGTGPASLDTRTEVCRSCRMPVSDPRLAAQIVSPGEEPKFFDDLGCLRDFLRSSPLAAGSAAYVADHRTGKWVAATAAVYTKAPGLATPMGSHWIAHADSASRNADAAAAGGAPVPAMEVLGPRAAAGRKP